MKKTLIALSTVSIGLSLLAATQSAAERDLLAKLPDIFAKSAAHYKALDAAATPLMTDKDGKPLIPHSYDAQKRELKMRPITWWTSGHFPGSLWYLYEATGDEFFKERALAWIGTMTSLSKFEGNHDIGFMTWCSFGNARRILKTDRYDEFLREAAATLCKRYEPKLGLIRSWGKADDTKDFLVIPDNMMNLELLESATYLLHGDTRFDQIARSHADVTMVHHFRKDGGCRHVVDYDLETGRVKEIRRGQGASSETAWSRGQSWAIYGYTMMYRMTTDPRYLEFAKKLAAFAMDNRNMPTDGIPFWDYGAPDEERDTSAGSIMASALLELSQFVGPKTAAICRAFAVKQLLALASDEYFSKGDEIGHFLLKHGVGHKPGNSEIDVPLNYGDYYFLEALLRFKALAEAPELSYAPPVELPDELYLDFSRTGNRKRYEKPYFARTFELMKHVNAERKAHDDRNIEAIAVYLKAICSERSWSMPAHDRSLACFNGKRLHIDLGCGHRALDVATALKVAGDKLPADVVALARRELERRAFGPYLETCHGAKIERHWWFHGNNNWNSVCHSCIVRAALMYYPEGSAERAEIIKGALSGVPYFLKGFTPDGYCSEGAGYWNYGFGHFLDMGIALREAPEKIDIFQDEHARKIAEYGFTYKLAPNISPLFADGGGTPSKECRALCRKIWPDLGKGPLAMRSVFPDAQVWIGRPVKPSRQALTVGWKGGHNNEFHNHNDVGSYTVAVGGTILSGDPGGEVYTRRTFSGKRYESKVLSSYAHPVPRVNGQLQPAGRKFAAKILKQELSDDCDTVAMELKDCYKDVPTLVSLVRTFRYDRKGKSFTVEDEVTCSAPTAFAVPVVTTCEYDALGARKGKQAVTIETKAEGGDYTLESETVDNPGRPSPKLRLVNFPAVTHATVTTRFTAR